MKSLNGKTAFITGGASGIGFAIAEAVGRAGMKVMLAGVNEANLDAAVERLRAKQIAVARVPCDVSKRADVEHAALATIAAFGKVHLVVNNAGVATGGQIGEVREADWRWLVDVNLFGVVHGTEVFAPLLAKHGEGGHIVNVASIAGMISGPGNEPYSATKYAVVAMSEGWRVQLAAKGIGVSVLCPAFVRTNISNSQRNRRPEERQVRDADTVAVLKKLVDEGMAPEMLAARVVEAIEDNELYVFTHPELKPVLEARFSAILTAMDKAARSPALADHQPQDLTAFGIPAVVRK
jgi:NAD(P)-dependent dehydrogenase (short-subunit alcohol dehydrogenase family)